MSLTGPKTNDVSQTRQRLAKLLQLHGYSACREALVLLVDHYTSSNKYDSIEDFICTLNRIITFETRTSDSIIDPDLADLAIKKLRNHSAPDGGDIFELEQAQETAAELERAKLIVRVKNVECYPAGVTGSRKTSTISANANTGAAAPGHGGPANNQRANEFNIHYNFLYKRLSSLPIFKDDYQLTRLERLTASTQPSIRCICFGLLVKDISKIDGYMLIDSSGRVPLRLTPDTAFRNRLAYTNCIVLVEGVYVNPDDILYAANIGLPPILLDPIEDKELACRDEKMIVLLRDLFMDDDDVCRHVDMLFTGYNSMEEPPLIFIMIGDFTRALYATAEEYRRHTKRLIRIIRTCDNLKQCHFVFVPGQRDTSQLVDGQPNENLLMPKPPLTKEQMPINLLQLSGFNDVHLATNPAHIYVGERQLTIVSQSYLKTLGKNLLHDLSDHREELFETAKQIILSNAHLAAGISKTYHSSMNLWHKPDLLVLADTEAFGNRYDYCSSKSKDTTFTTVHSFSRQFSQFKVYYLKTGDVEDSQVSSDAMEQIVEECDVDEEPVPTS